MSYTDRSATDGRLAGLLRSEPVRWSQALDVRRVHAGPARQAAPAYNRPPARPALRRVGPCSTVFAVAQDKNFVGEIGDNTEIMRDQEHRHAACLLQALKQRENLRLYAHVERGRRLVGDQQAGISGKRHGDGDPLLLATGQFMRIAAG